MEHIGIDFEYYAPRGEIVHLICACATSERGSTWRFWLRDGRDTEAFKKWLESYLNRKDVVFVSHALELAEARCLGKLYGSIRFAPKLQWRDTFHEAKLLANNFRKDTDKRTFSLAELCSDWLGVNIDLQEKEFMRQLCIDDTTEGYELAIMSYCLNDTKYLPQLAEKLLTCVQDRYTQSVSFIQGCSYNAVTHKRTDLTRSSIENLLIEQAAEILAFRRFAESGLPVSIERVEKLEKIAPLEIRRMQTEFNAKYPDAFRFDPDGTLHKDSKKFQEYLSELVKVIESDGTYYPRTPSGQLSTSSETLKKFFYHQPNFGGDALHLQNMTTQLQGLASGRWTENLNRERSTLDYQSLEPFASTTGRCQPKPGRGFVFGWSKCLYGVLEPPPGGWLVELDFSAEETAIMAILCQDVAYEGVYAAKDTYMWFCDQLKLIPHSDFISLSVDELKAKYKALRNKIKKFALAWGYGAGAAHLAELAGIDISQSKQWKQMLENEVFSQTTRVKRRMMELSGYSRQTGSSCRNSRPFSVPDGWMCHTGRTKHAFGRISETAMGNFFFQGWGAYILRQLVLRLCDLQDEGWQFEVVATIHDAICILVREGDTLTIEKVRQTMQETADELLEVPKSKRPFMRVGEADIIEHGKPWCPEKEHLEKFNQLLNTDTMSK